MEFGCGVYCIMPVSWIFKYLLSRSTISVAKLSIVRVESARLGLTSLNSVM